MAVISTPRLRRVWQAALAATCIIVLSVARVSAAVPQDLADCESSDDVPRMIAACTSLAQDMRLPADARSMALLKRGFGNFALNNIDAAQADFSEAIRLNPKNNYAHHELGLTLARKGDTVGAIASFTEAINLDPSSAASRFGRGRAYAAQDKLDEAIQDFTDAIKLGADKNTAFTTDETVSRPDADRVSTDYYAARADAYYLKGDYKDAAADYDHAAKLVDSEGYFLIWGSVARTQAGAADADVALAAALDKGQLKDWPKSVGDLLVRRITPAAALAAAKDDNQTCEAHYYSAVAQLKAKDVSAAQTEFAAARDGCPKTFREYYAAIADLKRLPTK
jgi:tetratricopeptide (TPR) repeat protein